MDYNSLDDYIHAWRGRRDHFWALDNDKEADQAERYADAIDFPMRHVRYGTKLTTEEVETYHRDLLRISDPSEIQSLVPFHRWRAVYDAVMKLAVCMERVKAGRPARKKLGIF